MGVRVQLKQGLLLLLLTAVFSAVGWAGTAKPSAPGNFKGTAGSSWVSLTWSPAAGAASYRVKRSTSSSGSFSEIAAPVSNGCTDAGLTDGKTYFYVVSAVNSAGESANSAVISLKPAASTQASRTPSVPTGLTATAGTGWVSLSWSPTAGATSYRVKRAYSSGGTFADIGAPVSNRVTDAGLTNGNTYFYVVSAVNADGQSSNSSQVSAKPTGGNASSTPVASSPAPQQTSEPASGTVAPTLFSQTINSLSAHDFPSVPFGSMRLWGTFTTWGEIEISSNNYKWSELDAWLELAGKEQKDVLYTFGVTPQWASMRPSEACTQAYGNLGCAAPPADVDSGDAHWKAFVTALVKHSLASSSGHIKYYEIWNEPNDPKCWTGSYAQLATMAKDAYAIIHSLDPEAKVVGPSPTGSNTVQWLASFYAAGGRNAQDVVALHSYLTAKTDSPAIATRVDSLRSMMTSNGIGDLPIWSTEGGFGTLPMSDSQRVATVGQMYTLLWSKDVARFYWYAWDSINGWGTMWTSSGGVNASGTAYGVLYHWLVGSSHATNPCSEASDGTWTCALTLSSGYPAEIVWNASTSKTITVSSAFATYETLANNTVHSISENKVAIGSEPILIIKSQAVSQ